MRHHCQLTATAAEPTSKSQTVGVAEAKITTLGLAGDTDVRSLLRRALRDAEPAAQRFGWHVVSLCELPRDDDDVGYTEKDGTIFVKVRDPTVTGGGNRRAHLYAYSFVLATLLHELVHLSHLGHGKAFYRCLSAALTACGAEAYVRREARAHVCAELLNAVCDNDARRARALLAVMPEAAVCRRPGATNSQMPLEYAAHHGRVALTRLLLEARADPAMCSGTVPGGSSVAPLARAAANGNTKTAALLLAAGAKVVDVPEARGQSVLDKAIAASEAGGFSGKGGEWWKVSKVLSSECCDAGRPACEISERSRSTGTSRRRRRRRSSSETHRPPASAPPPTAPAPPASAPGVMLRKAISLPLLPAQAEVRRPMLLGSLAGSLAL